MTLPKRLLTLGIMAAAAAAGNAFRPADGPPAGGVGDVQPAIRAFGPIHPRLSPDGGRAAFSYQGALWRLPSGGGVMTRLTGGPGFDVEPAWSPDGRRIAYLNTSGYYGGTLRLVDAENGSPVPLPKEASASDKLTFSPDGRRILGNFQGGGRTQSLGWYALETGEVAPVAAGPVRPYRHALSGDGARVAFVTTQDVPGQQGGNDGPEADVWTVPSEGGEPSKLVRFPARIHDLCWEAGDRALIVSTEVGGVHNDLWRVPLDDPERGASRLTFGQADEDRPSVSADGRRLLFTDNREGPTALVVRDLSTGREETLEVIGRDFRAPTGRLSLTLRGSEGQPAPTARVAVRGDDGRYHAPPGSLYRLHKGDLHFYVNGRVEFELPAGRYEVSAARGPECRVARLTLEVGPGGTTAGELAPSRWTDQPARGWFPGESHIHANYGYGHWYNSPASMLLQCSGEDLAVSNLMVANSDGDGVFDREYFRGRPDPLSGGGRFLYWNEEFRSTVWGHMTLLNLKQLVVPIDTGFPRTTHPYDAPTNADVADLTHDQGGHVNYTHPAQSPADPYEGAYTAKALPMDVALGKVDSVDVMGSNHLANLLLWYRLLNCGFKVSASAGTDCFLNRIPSRLPGSDRVYVKISNGFTYENWAGGLKAGRTFVTNGPMLEFTADGLDPGETVRVGPGAGVRVRARVTSQFPIDRLEVVRNGEVVAAAGAAGDRLSAEIDRPVVFDRTGWLAVRAVGPPHRDQAASSNFAHSGPAYVEVAGRPAAAAEDAAYFLSWVDRLAAEVRRRDRVPPRLRDHVEGQIAAAKRVYEKLMEAR